MRLIADFHLHSKYSRATSKELDIENLERYAHIKGVDILGTGDFCHPEWLKNLKSKLSEDGSGILRTASGFPFVLQNELSFIYTDSGKGRRIHLVLLAKSFDVVDQITEEMLRHGRVDYDGRPIFNLSCPDFVERMMKIDEKIEIIPAHIWTPWFGLLGSKSGFDSIKDCFRDQARNIHAIETGLSSNPEMNWRLNQLDKYSIVSFSDLHSFWPWRIGREATIFEFGSDKDLTYDNIIKGLRTGDGLAGTIEVDPSYGKYHYDGHRNCNVVFEPEETKKHNGICPVCKRPLTIGVLNRVEELADADRPEGFKPKHTKPFYSLIPLSEIIAGVVGKGIATNLVWNEYYKIVNEKQGRTENKVLLETGFEELKKLTSEKIADAIIKNREGKIEIKPGYDGEYGYPVFDREKEMEKEAEKEKSKKKAGPDAEKQKGLSDFM